MRFRQLALSTFALSAICAAIPSVALASSHREAPFITTSPKVDGTDFYMFRSYEANKSEFVTLIANYQPLQDAYGGPNYFTMDPNALYEIHIDNNADSKEDITFQFRFKNTLKDIQLPIGSAMVSSPLTQIGMVKNRNDANLAINETYTVNVVRGDRRTGTSQAVTKVAGGSNAMTFEKPMDYIGEKTFGNAAAYALYAGQHIHDVTIPGCATPGRVFVGQRQEGFAVNLGGIFDLVNATAAQITNKDLKNAFVANGVQDKNVTSLSIEVPIACLTAGAEPVIGGWTTASLRQGRLLNGAPASGHQTSEKAGGAWTQVSRLGNPLVNEVVIGLKDKDKFNASKPINDASNFLTYVLNPTLPALLGAVLVGGQDGLKALAPTNLPRADLATVFLTGIPSVNYPNAVNKSPTPSEMLRLNTAVAPVAYADQNRLGVVGEIAKVGGPANLSKAKDLAGFPNGRRPKDDVVDIALVAVLGGLCDPLLNGANNALGFDAVPGIPSIKSTCNPSSISVNLGGNVLAVHDGVDQAEVPFLTAFPYLNTPKPGATNPK